MSEEEIGSTRASFHDRNLLGQVWVFATLIFALSSAFFVMATGVTAMILPLSLVAVGIGMIGTLRVLATQRRSG